MAFTGKATYSGGETLPEIAEDVSDLVAINSPHETPLLDALGDATRVARSTVHEWLEDSLLPNTSTIAASSFTPDATTDTEFEVEHIARFRVGDLVRPEGSGEVMLVSAVDELSETITVERGYGGSTAEALEEGQPVQVIGNAALEGDDASAARFSLRSRKTNYTQIFAQTVEVSGSELAVRQIGVGDELEHQKNLRLREMLRDLEATVINGVTAGSSPEGSASVRRSMRGILASITSNIFVAGENAFPADTTLTEAQLNLALRRIWQDSSGRVDLIVCGGAQKRAINAFVSSDRRYSAQGDVFKDGVSIYESDFGICRVVLSRAVPAGRVLLLDSSRIEVMPLAGRSFHYRTLARTGDRESGQLVGEYTLEFRNENAHGVIAGLA